MSLQPDKVVLGKFLTTSCYGTIYALDDLLPMWDRWQDIPPAEPARYPQVKQDLLFSVNPTCGAGDAIVGVRGMGVDSFWHACLACGSRDGCIAEAPR